MRSRSASFDEEKENNATDTVTPGRVIVVLNSVNGNVRCVCANKNQMAAVAASHR